MARLCFAAVFVVLLQIFTHVQACDPIFGKAFDRSDERIQNRIYTGKRLSGATTFLTRVVFTTLECLDICLRFDQCVSFDFQALSSHENICRIYYDRGIQDILETMPFVEETNWTHFNLSSAYLREVSWIISTTIIEL